MTAAHAWCVLGVLMTALVLYGVAWPMLRDWRQGKRDAKALQLAARRQDAGGVDGHAEGYRVAQA